MSLVQWSDELTVGVAAVDDDHRKLFSLVNYLYDSMVAGRERPVVDDFINSLLIYTREHFAREEAFFEETGYPDSFVHKKEHDDLIRQITDVRESFKSGATPQKTLEMIGFLNKWLIEHIRKSDKKYAPHLHAQGIS
ncbi:MAG: bacteriohemerythrin [Telmatospirillum sp.]|nr:bacteriohemerythrin [Telmatospirillum sp.]